LVNVKIVFNSSPLIFLARMEFLDKFLDSPDEFYLPIFVAEEISAKSDEASGQVKALIDIGNITVRAIQLISLANSLNMRLGKGESEAIALGIELQTDYIILDDFAAIKEATRLGLNVKGTLAIIKKLQVDGKITISSLEQLYQDLVTINFRVKRSLFDTIFGD
jgi:predicted nucleic acid-binding protein